MNQPYEPVIDLKAGFNLRVGAEVAMLGSSVAWMQLEAWLIRLRSRWAEASASVEMGGSRQIATLAEVRVL